MVQTAVAIVQGVAAVVQGTAAVVLVKITRDYVHLTQRLAVASEAQVELLRAERGKDKSAALAELTELAKFLRERLQQLPGPGPDAQQSAAGRILEATLPSEKDMDRLRELAARIGS